MEISYKSGLLAVDLKELGQRLRQARERLGFSQEDFAVAVGKDQAAISDYELGKRRPSITDLPRFAEVLHVSLLYFFEGDISVSDLDRELLHQFHQIPQSEKARAIEVMRLLAMMTQG